MKCNMPVKEEQYSCCLGCCVEDSANVIPVTAASTLNPTDWWLVNRYLDTILITGIIYPNSHKTTTNCCTPMKFHKTFHQVPMETIIFDLITGLQYF